MGASETLSTGIPGLDEVLQGGLDPGSLCLVEGTSGAGKTNLGLHFALEGTRRGEAVLYLTLGETKRELQALASSHEWDTTGLDIVESVRTDSPSSLFHPAEVELDEIINLIVAQVERIGPSRVIVDSLAEIRLLAQNQLRFRTAVSRLKEFFSRHEVTVLLLGEPTEDISTRSLVGGVIALEHRPRGYGDDRRLMRVVKLRGRTYASGYHDFLIAKGGLQVFPRLGAVEHSTEFDFELLPSGIPGLDDLLGGGVRAGASTLLLGAAGTGKSSIALHFATAAAIQGRNASLFAFDERPSVVVRRMSALDTRFRGQFDEGRILIRPVDMAGLSAGQFAHLVRRDVEERETKVVIIDSLNGYLSSMMGEEYLDAHLHHLLSYLGEQGVASFLVVSQTGVLDSDSAINITYLADNVLYLRFFEAEGEVRRAISAIKVRTGAHERTIRELLFSSSGIGLGPPLREYRGILSGIPFVAEDQGSARDSG
jgi:circadian clock protein KaiC